MKVLLTGASGFLGSCIFENLVRRSVRVVAVVRQLEKYDLSKVNDLTEIIQIDLTNTKKIDENKIPKDIDQVIHCAGLAHQFGQTSKQKFHEVNVKGTEKIARLAAEIGAKRLILISSVAVYGDGNGKILNESDACRPNGFYAESKLESENVCRQVCAESKMPLTIVRPATIVGEGDRGNVFRLIKLIENGFFVWIGSGENRKSLIYKNDVAEACFKILQQSSVQTEIYNLTAEPVSMKVIVREISYALGRPEPLWRIPDFVPNTIFCLNDNSFSFGKINKLKETLKKWRTEEIFSAEKIYLEKNFRPFLSAKEAVRREVEWYLKQK